MENQLRGRGDNRKKIHTIISDRVKYKPSQCFGFKLLPVLDGEYDPSSVYVASIEEYWDCCGDVHEQIDDLPDGTEIEIDISER